MIALPAGNLGMKIRYNMPTEDDDTQFMYSSNEDATIEIYVMTRFFIDDYLNNVEITNGEFALLFTPDGVEHEVREGDIVVFDKCYSNASFILDHIDNLQFQGVTFTTMAALVKRGYKPLHVARHHIRFHTTEAYAEAISDIQADMIGHVTGWPCHMTDQVVGVPVR